MNVVNVLRRISKPTLMTKRDFAQVGMVVSNPPRIYVSLGEKLLHAAFMVTVWTTPIFYFETQLKVWRRDYIGP